MPFRAQHRETNCCYLLSYSLSANKIYGQKLSFFETYLTGNPLLPEKKKDVKENLLSLISYVMTNE